MYLHIFEGRCRCMGPALLVVLSALALTLPGRLTAQAISAVQKVDSGLFASHEVIELSLEANFMKLKADRGLDS